MKRLQLFLPSITLTSEITFVDRAAEFGMLARVLGRATQHPDPTPTEALLCAAFGRTAPGGVAALTARIDFKNETDDAEILRADPVHLHVDPNKVLLFGPAQLALTAAEADAFLEVLRAEFPSLAWRRASPTRWYIRRPSDVWAAAPSAAWLHGRSISPFFPTATTDRAWRRLLNDVQMVLHDHPLNQTRVARGLPAVNGVWVFGGGSINAAAATPITRTFGNDVLLHGLAAAHGVQSQRNNTPAAALAASGEAVVVAGPAFGRAAEEIAAITIADINSDWLPAVLRALRVGRIRQLDVVTHGHRSVLRGFGAWRPTSARASFTLDDSEMI
ncbi:MAG: hypothetical protein HYX63_20960 [Gammaproteobacteria bacterium]|nr:hypothetical protein [Gammaproteobacteria bacterium]